mgnify:CR=1 FL=1
MRIEFDPAKNAVNIRDRGLAFELAEEFDFSTAWIVQDLRHSYPEVRFQALSFIDQRLYMLVFSPNFDGIRVISFRKANKREVKQYEKETQS